MEQVDNCDDETHMYWAYHPSHSQPQGTQSSGPNEETMVTMPKREQKRRPKPKDRSILICGVCGDKALGYNFDAITCESCKAFFRRNALKTKSFSCSFDGNCRLDAHTRKFCAGCRLKKCFNIGMKKEWILTDSQLEKRRRRNSYKRSEHFGSSDQEEDVLNSGGESVSGHVYGEDSGSVSGSVSNSPLEVMGKSPLGHFDTVCSPQSDSSSVTTSFSDPGHLVIKTEKLGYEDDIITPLSEETRSNINHITSTYSSVFDAPYGAEQTKRLKSSVRSADDLFNMTDVFIKRLIKFSKSIPEFRDLKQEDQISLLKGGVMEIMYLRSASSMDKKKLSWVFQSQDGQGNLKTDVLHSLGEKGFSNHMNFVCSLRQLCECDPIIMILLFVIELFSPDRANLTNKILVSRAQEKFSLWMKLYVESKYPLSEARVLYPKLLMKLTDVRSLGEHSSQMASQLDVSRMEPLLVEVFNLSS